MALHATPAQAFAVPVLAVEIPNDVPARETLLDRAMGSGRKNKTSERLRLGQTPEIALVAHQDACLVGTLRLWKVRTCGLGPALLLGPLAVDQGSRGLGLGSALMGMAIETARRNGASAIILVGDPEYYGRFGFSARVARRLSMPGPFERHRLLGLELHPHALERAHGVLKAGQLFTQTRQPASAA